MKYATVGPDDSKPIDSKLLALVNFLLLTNIKQLVDSKLLPFWKEAKTGISKHYDYEMYAFLRFESLKL